MTVPSDAGDRAGLSARPLEYEAATMDWLSRTVAFLMVVRDRLYADLRSEQVEWHEDTLVDLGGGRELVVEPQPVAVAGSIEIGSVLSGDFGDLHAEVSSIADQRLEQIMRAYFVLLRDLTVSRPDVRSWR
jgi:hypothetical protein